MIGALVGNGRQAILNLRPDLYWDARFGNIAGGVARAGGALPVTVYSDDGGSDGKWFAMNGAKQFRLMQNDTSTADGQERVFGAAGHFYHGTVSYHGSYTTSKYNYAVVAPTAAGALTEDGAAFPSITKDALIADQRYRVYLDSSLDAVNDVVVERSQSRSATYARTFQVLVRRSDGLGDPSTVFELGWNTTAGTRTTEAASTLSLNYDGWWAIHIIVPPHATDTAGYCSIKLKANFGVWEIALPAFFNNYSGHERITRAGFAPTSTVTRSKWAVKTTNAELVIRPRGWLALSVVMPRLSVHNGYLNNSGSGDYGFHGLFNLDCDTWRVRASMSDTYDRLVVTLGTTAGVNFAYLDGLTDWQDWMAIGMVAYWETNNQNQYAGLYVNGERLDAVANPASWFPDTNLPGTAHVGISGASGTVAECMLSQVAYGTRELHAADARTLSVVMQNMALARGGRREVVFV